jgi:hypothetical protein
LKSKDEEYPDVRVVGADPRAGSYIVEDADSFGAGPRLLDPEEAATVYAVTDPPEHVDEQRGWDSLATAHTRAILPPRPQSPEERFAAGTADPVSEDGEGGRRGRVTFTEDAPWLR